MLTDFYLHSNTVVTCMIESTINARIPFQNANTAKVFL